MPSIAHRTHEPGAWLASPTNSAEGSATSTRPPDRISNTPISLVAPKRFFSARRVRKLRSRSPSNSSTQSTRCSSALGPATVPSLVTCPTRITAVSIRLATCMIAAAASRTWPTDPGAPPISSTCRVWIESTTQASGRSASSVAMIASTEVSDRMWTPSAWSPSRSARSRTCAADSSPEMYRTRRPAADRLPSAMPVSVLLPIPGDPPRRTSEPGTSPPPSTRSSSATPVCRRLAAGALTSRSGTGSPAPPPPVPAVGARARPRRAPPPCGRGVSTRVFHSPQPGQRPVQAGATCPHCWQTKWESLRAIR